MNRALGLCAASCALVCTLWLVGSPGLGAAVPGSVIVRAKADAGVHTVVFQQGVSPSGYQGSTDTHLDFYSQGKNEGGRADFGVTFDDKKRSLVRFELSEQIPQGARVLTATVRLRVNSRTASSSIGLRCYQVLQPWSEEDATWLEAESGTAWWGGPGCDGISRSDVPALEAVVNQASGSDANLDWTDVVQHWVDHPTENHGLLLQGYQALGRVSYSFASSESIGVTYRPRLEVTYEGDPPLATPTPTRTPTRTPTPPNPTTIYSTLSDWKFDQCLKTGKDPGVPPTVRTSPVETMIIMWDGIVYSAKLHMVVCQTNVGAEHPIYLNGHLVGRTPPEGTTGCECNLFPIDPNHQRTFEIDPSIVLQGANYITVTNSADPYEEWKGSRAQIELVGHITGTTRSEFQLGTDWEDQRLKAAMQLPMEYDSGGATPLLISLPGTGEDRIDGLNRFAIEANEMGWLLASLDMRHIRWSAVYEQVARSPSLAVQRDVLELLEHMRLHFGVDLSKVYVAGFSTGGGSAATVAAKYPDLLAGALDYSGPADYGQWYAERPDLLTKLEFEFGGGPVANFEYPRRSSRWLSRNLQYVPMRIRHSAVGDTDVPFVQSQNLLLSMSSYFDPSLHHKELITHTQGHVDPDSTAKLNDLQFLESYVSVGNPQELHILTDEGKDYYWLGVSKAETADNDWQGWVAVDVRYDAAADAIWLAAGDGDFAEGKPLTVTLDLNRMGLAATGPFDAEEYDRNTGEFALHTILPEEGILTLSVPRNAQGVVGREYAIYPSIGAGLGYADLRQGRDGYAGTSDTHIVSDQFPSEGPETPHAQELALQLGCDWRRKALVRFDLSPIPQGVVIKGARLTLALLESRSVGIDVDVYEALTSWEPGFATWTLSDEGKPWSAAGAEGVDSDRAADAYHILHDVRSPGLYSLNAKHLVEKWLATPESNRGLVLIGGGSCSSSTRYPLGSAENGDEGLRPQLEVWYMAPMPALTPTPTATTSPTACTLQGSVSLQGRPAPPHESWSIALLVTIGGTTHNVNSSQMGMFTLPDLTAGTFDIGVKNDHTLRKLKTGVTLVAGETRTVDFGKLLEGDANGDNRVNVSDFSILAGGFSPAYDARADFNEDGVVSIADFSLLGSNFNMTGE